MNSIHEASPLQSLPGELQIAICSHLKDIDLSIMELTCKHFKELLKDDLFWKEKTPLSEAYPDLSAKERLLKNYRDYCNFFSEIFPELKEGPSLDAFQKKKQTDEVVKKSFEERSTDDSGSIFLTIFDDKKELIHLVVDVFVGLTLLPSDQKLKLEKLNLEIMNASLMRAPNTFISLVKKLNINFREFPLEIQERLLHAAIGWAKELVPFLIDQGIKPSQQNLESAKWSPELIPILTRAME